MQLEQTVNPVGKLALIGSCNEFAALFNVIDEDAWTTHWEADSAETQVICELRSKQFRKLLK